MTFSYDQARTTAKDRLRFALGDTVSPGLLQDEDYTASLALYASNEADALRNLAAGLAAKFAAEPDRVTLPSGLSVAWSERIAQWNRLAEGPTVPRSNRARLGQITTGTDWTPK